MDFGAPLALKIAEKSLAVEIPAAKREDGGALYMGLQDWLLNLQDRLSNSLEEM
jgi:hypothetical protein